MEMVLVKSKKDREEPLISHIQPGAETRQHFERELVTQGLINECGLALGPVAPALKAWSSVQQCFEQGLQEVDWIISGFLH